MKKNVLGNRIECLRKELGLNQIELSQKLNLSSSASISQYESGDRIPSDDIKLNMAKLFNCSLDYLMGITDVRTASSQIDEVLNEEMVGMTKEEYNKLSDAQKKQIRDFALFVKEQGKKEIDDLPQ